MERGSGGCLEKNEFLGAKLEQEGLQVKYILIDFDWKDLPIPNHILELREDTQSQHLALKVKRDGKWIYVDASWDPPLRKAGFALTLAEDWDTYSSTDLAVNPLKEKELDQKMGRTKVEPDNPEFYEALNNYLERVRNQN